MSARGRIRCCDIRIRRKQSPTPNAQRPTLNLGIVNWTFGVGRLNSVMPSARKTSRLTLLGRSEAKIPVSPEKARLETFSNPAQREYHIQFETDDFTCLCPVTGQADFARIEIDYVPDRLCVESKSLKFYLAAYRNVRAFNEAVTNRILDDFVRACSPRSAMVSGRFSARGGIALTVRAEYSASNAKRTGRNGR